MRHANHDGPITCQWPYGQGVLLEKAPGPPLLHSQALDRNNTRLLNEPEREAKKLIIRRTKNSEMADKNSISSTGTQGGGILAG